jgi:eukaryotic-like serine/threonine-protein kinase
MAIPQSVPVALEGRHVIGRRIGRYRIVAKVGQGGLATVWKAHDELLGRDVALKVLHDHAAASPKARRRFLHDAQAAAALDHPGVVAVYDTGEAEGLAYIALSLIDGETVSEMAARRLLPVAEAVRIVRDAAEALGHAHARGVIHRDVTGRNIMVARDGRVFVLDFGLALALWESRVTTTEAAMGTALYMAPEVILARKADARSDLYGLGVVLYEALTGTFPFAADQPQAVFYSATSLAPVPPRARRPEIPTALESIVLKAIARDPAVRYQNADELVAELRRVDLSEPAPELQRAESSIPGGATNGSGHASPEPSAWSHHGHGDPLYLAVLPFESDAAADPEGACRALASRLGETVSSALAKTAVHVVAPGDGPLPATPREVARQLGANAILQGSVRRSGSQLRVTYAVLDPFRGVQIAGDVLDGSAMRVFDVEDQVVASVTRALGGERAVDTKVSRPADPAAHERYLQALANLKRYDNEASVDGAIRTLEKLIVSQGHVALYHAALARAYLFKYEHTKERSWESRAAACCERARMLDADAPEVRVALGDLQTGAGRHDVACAEFEAALERQPDDFDAMLGLARAHRRAGRLSEAKEICRCAIEKRPDDWRGHILLGQIHYRGGEFAEAVVPWRRVLELTPDNAMGRRYLGSALHLLERHDEAIAAYRESIAIQPNDEAYTNLGTTLFFLGRFEESVPALRKAVELAPSDPWRWGNLGNACRWIPGREAESRQALESAIGLMRERLERNPTQAEWWARMAGWLANLGRFDEATTAIRRALALGPEDVHCMARAVQVLYQVGERAESLHWLRRARKAGYRMAELRRSIGMAQLREDPAFRALFEDGQDEAGGSEAEPTP